MPALEALVIDDRPEVWRAAGFDVSDGMTRIGNVALLFEPSDAPNGIIAWVLSDASTSVIDGLPTRRLTDELAQRRSAFEPAHAIGDVSIDHLVIRSANVDRTAAELSAQGFDERRRRTVGENTQNAFQQVFFWAGEVIIELVGPLTPSLDDRPAHFWGLALSSPDLDASVAALGSHISTPKPAVQPGRRIATVDTSSIGCSVPIALMSPHTRSNPADPTQ